MTTTTERAVVPRAILEDRWDCATHRRELGDDWSKLMVRLDESLVALQEAVTRRTWTGESETGDGTGEVHAAVHDAVRRTMLDEIERWGIAR